MIYVCTVYCIRSIYCVTSKHFNTFNTRHSTHAIILALYETLDLPLLEQQTKS